jgi:hypothetical protein
MQQIFLKIKAGNLSSAAVGASNRGTLGAPVGNNN